MSLWLLATTSLAPIAAAATGRVWLILLAVAYSTAVLARFFLLAAP